MVNAQPNGVSQKLFRNSLQLVQATDKDQVVTQTDTSPTSLWPAFGGGLLALGLALAIFPAIFRDATGLTSPFFTPLIVTGVVALIAAIAIFATLVGRQVVHATRRAPIR